MLRRLIALSLLAATAGAVRNAAACGPTPYMLDALLPASGASNVPLNAALIASSNETEAAIWLRRAGAAAGASISVELECDHAFAGAVCVARPSELLQPNTRYEWRAAMSPPQGYEEGTSPAPEWREFTTGSELDSEPPAAGAVLIRITNDQSFSNPPCGIDRSVELDYVPNALREPVVLRFAGFTPSYVMQATLLTPDMAAAQATLYSPPACLSPVAYDQVGNRIALAELCLGAAPEPEPLAGPGEGVMGSLEQPGDVAGSAAPAGGVALRPLSSDSGGGCSLALREKHARSWLLLGLLLCARRRSRH